jgi:hypothetical protein
LTTNFNVVMANISFWHVSVFIYNLFNLQIHYLAFKFTIHKCFRWNYILPTIAFGFKGKILMLEKPLHMLVIVSVFISVRDTHCAKSSLLTPFTKFLAYVQTFLYIWKTVLKILKHETWNGYNACEVCDNMMIKSSCTPIALCTHLR